MRAITQERFKYLLQFIATQGPGPLKGNMRTTCSSILPYEAPNYKSANGPRKAVGTQVERLSSRQQKSTLTMKRVSPHDKKGFTSRAQAAQGRCRAKRRQLPAPSDQAIEGKKRAGRLLAVERRGNAPATIKKSRHRKLSASACRIRS